MSFLPKTLPPLEQDQDDDAGLDFIVSPPRPNEAMLYGFPGKVGRIAAETTEANPFAVCMDTILMLSAEFGRDVYLPIGNTFHHPRLFGLHVGRSGKGRKGDALSLPVRIRNKTLDLYSNLSAELLGQIHTGGLSSREGLAVLIHDGYKEGKNEVPAINDKRLFIVESEFANVLHQARRDGNTLSAALRDVWDGQSIKPATKTNRISATNPHISLLGHITPSELVELMRSRELSNGFANRFLIFLAERDRLVPLPSPTDASTVTSLAHQFKNIIEFAKGGYPDQQNTRRAELSADAQMLYKEMYKTLSKSVDGGVIDGILERRPANLLRLALCLALIDKTLTIDAQHIQAAFAWIQYCSESVRYIFQSGEQEQAANDTKQAAAKIFEYLRENGEASRTEISKRCFNGHKKSAEIEAALNLLLSESPPLVDIQEKACNGRVLKIYSLRAKKANYANNQSRRRLEGEKDNREQCELSELSPCFENHNSHNSHNSQPITTSVSTDMPVNSLNSLNSRAVNEMSTDKGVI